MISYIQRRSVPWLGGELCGWFLKDLGHKQLYGELCDLDMRGGHLQFVVAHLH